MLSSCSQGGIQKFFEGGGLKKISMGGKNLRVVLDFVFFKNPSKLKTFSRKWEGGFRPQKPLPENVPVLLQ